MSDSGTSGRTSRTRVRAAAWTATLAFGAVLTAIEVMAVRGQLDFGRHVLRLEGRWLVVPPIALEGGMLAAAALTLWAVLSRDSAALPRLMTFALIGAAAYANYRGAVAANRPPLAAEYLAGASVFAYLMWHSILTRIRRQELRASGALAPPLPRFRLLHWAVAPGETWAACKISIREGITRPEQALAMVRGEALGTPPPPPASDAAPVDLTRVTKRAAVEYAASVLKTYEVTPVREWLAEQGVSVDKSHACRVLNELSRGETRKVKAVQLRALEGGAE